MNLIKITPYLLLIFMVFSVSSCIDMEEIIEREATEKKMLKAAQIVKAIPLSNIGVVKNIGFEACNEALRKELTYIIDIRSQNEFRKTHIENAINIPLNERGFLKKIALLDKKEKLIVYGGHDKSNEKAARIMLITEFDDVYNLTSSVNECINVKVKLGKNDNPVNIAFQKKIASMNGEKYIDVMELINNIDLSLFKDMLNHENTIVDLRSVNDFVSGHIEGAMHIDWSNGAFITKVVNLIPNDKPIVLYGDNKGIDGENAMLLMKSLGYTKLSNLEGGIDTYLNAKLPLKVLEIEGDPLHLNEDNFAKAIIGELGTIVDVRSMGEFDIAHIPNAILVDVKKSNFKEVFSKVDRTKPVFLYCRTGIRSMKASKIAKELGYNVFNLDHGFKGWLKHHKPIIGVAHNIDNGEEGC